MEGCVFIDRNEESGPGVGLRDPIWSYAANAKVARQTNGLYGSLSALLGIRLPARRFQRLSRIRHQLAKPPSLFQGLADIEPVIEGVLVALGRPPTPSKYFIFLLPERA
jgi:hypothetical protein